MVMETAQEALEETLQGTPSLLAPAREAPALLIVETLISHHFHHQQERIIANHLRYRHKYHHNHQALRIQARSKKSNFPTSLRKTQRTRTSPTAIGLQEWTATSDTSKTIITMTMTRSSLLEVSFERKLWVGTTTNKNSLGS